MNMATLVARALRKAIYDVYLMMDQISVDGKAS